MSATVHDLFSFYPDRPGYKRSGTSQQAAQDIAPRAMTLRDRVYQILKHQDCTADECAAILGEDKGNIRPRCSELAKKGLIWDSGETRPTFCGKPSIVWTTRNLENPGGLK